MLCPFGRPQTIVIAMIFCLFPKYPIFIFLGGDISRIENLFIILTLKALGVT